MERAEKRSCINRMKTEFRAISENESLARSLSCAFISQLSPGVGELSDVRCAVSEAVTNAIVHGYANAGGARNTVCLQIWLYSDRSVKIAVRDRGVGIPDVKAAMEPMYTTDTSGERSGMGFAIMSCFMDRLCVKSMPGKGTAVEMHKKFEPVAQPEGESEDAGQNAG